MRDYSECKAEIRRQMAEKTKHRSALRKRLISSLAIGAAALMCFGIAVFFPGIAENEKTVCIPADGVKVYDRFEDIVKDSDLIFIGTVQSERLVSNDPSTSQNIKTNYLFAIERSIVGPPEKRSVGVVVNGGTVDQITYVLEGSENYIVGERYVVFLRNGNQAGAAAASFTEKYFETSPLQGKIRLYDGEIDANASSWKDVDGFSPTQSIEELIQEIQKIKEST